MTGRRMSLFPILWSPPQFPAKVKASVEQLVEQIANRQRESLELRDQFIEFRANRSLDR